MLSIMLIFMGQLNAQNYAQPISLNLKNVTLKDFIKQVESKTPFTIVYRDVLIDNKKDISISVSSRPLNEVIKKVLAMKGLQADYSNNIIVITKIEPDQQPIKNKKISGLVTDQNGEPIIGASIVENSTNKGTVTDINGQFSLETPNTGQIKVSYIGYENQLIDITEKSSLRISLRETSRNLDEIVVVGYGTVRKSDLTGAVTSVKTKDLPFASNTSITHMLAGQAAGVMTRQVSNQPGGGIEILIRGAASTGAGNDPLFVIDGFPITNKSVEPESGNRYEMGSRNPLNSINPNDIESIEILKDASSTAIYGARAANGVVLITTKKGKKGKPVVKYNANYSTQRISKRVNMLSAKEYMQVSNEISREKWMIDNELAPYGPEKEVDALPYKGDPFTITQINNAGLGTDWFGAITRQGAINQHNISISSGTESTRYLFSLNYFKQDGVVKNSDFRRISGRINLDQDIGKYITIGINTTYSDIFNNNVPLGNGSAENSSLLNSALQYDPLTPIRDDQGNFPISSKLGQIPNPASMLEITDQTNTKRLLANIYAELTAFKNLKIRLNLGLDQNQGYRNTYLPKTTLYGKQEGGKANINSSSTLDLLSELTLKYSKQIFDKRDKFDFLLGYSYQKENWDGVSAGSSQFFTDLFLWNKLEAGNVARPLVTSYKGQNILASYFSRINYSINDKYLLTVSIRDDGSTKFGVNNRRAFFPSGAVAWKINNESYLNKIDWISILKARVSYGQTGNSNIGGNAYEYYASGSRYVFGDAVLSGTQKSQLENPNLKWETTTELNIGFDYGFLKNRISGSFEYFNKIVSDLLAFRNLNSLMDVPIIADNIGATQSSGFEFSLNTVNIDSKIKWKSIFNISNYNDRWKERNPDVVLAPYQRVDDPIRAVYGYLSDGILQIEEQKPIAMPNLLPGQMKVRDVNGFDPTDGTKLIGHSDGKIDAADQVFLGTTDPKFIIGFGNSLEYSGFDFNIFFYGMFDQFVWDPNKSKYGPGSCEYILDGQNYSTDVMNRWTPQNPNSKYPSGFVSQYYGSNDWLRQKISFVRCKNITIGYTLPSKLIHKVFTNARLYIDFGNPFVLTNYEGIDPEGDSTGGYPPQKTFSIGVDIVI